MSVEFSRTVRRALEDAGVQNTTIVVAVSGGVDSITLLDVVHRLSAVLALQLVVAHAHHGLRGIEADNDQLFVIGTCDSLGLPCRTERLLVSEYAAECGLGIEASARELRYGFLLRVAKDAGASAVLVGHNADDAAETLLLHIARGSGLDGLTSHRPVRRLDSTVRLVRPMLELQRRDVVAYATHHELRWREDSTNVELHFLRNRVRAEVMPALRNVFDQDVSLRIARTAHLLRDARSIVRRSLTLHDDLVYEDTNHHLHIPLAPFQSLPVPMQREFVRALLRKHTGVVATYTDTLRLLDLVEAEVGSRASLAGKLVAWREREELRIMPDQLRECADIAVLGDGIYLAEGMRLAVRTTPADEIHIDPDVSVAYLDASCIVGKMSWRTWIEGERIVPFGMQEAVLVADLLTNARIPVSVRRQSRVIADELGILWVCGIRQSERTRITSTTQHITTLTLA